MSSLELSKILEIMVFASSVAGDLQMQSFRKDFKIEEKSSHKDLVTEVDLKSQKIILDEITKELQKEGFNIDDFGFIGEEEGLNTRKKYNFIIDPIDGTSNYTIGLEFFSVLIALEIDKEIVVGLIYKPYDKSYFYAIKGQGAYNVFQEDKTRLRLNPVPEKDLSLSISISSYNFLDPIFYDKIRAVRQIYGIGIEAAYLAQNVFNIIFYVSNRGPKIWDIAGVQLIIKEAGGQLVTPEGKAVVLDYDDIYKTYKFIGGHIENINKILPYTKLP